VVNNIPNVPSFNWDAATGAYTGQTIYPARVPSQSNISGGVAYVWPDALTMGMVQNWNVGGEYLLGNDTVLSLNYLGNHGSHLHDGTIWPYNFSTQSTYMSLYNSGQALDMVTDPASAAAAGVSYPFPGFLGNRLPGDHAVSADILAVAPKRSVPGERRYLCEQLRGDGCRGQNEECPWPDHGCQLHSVALYGVCQPQRRFRRCAVGHRSLRRIHICCRSSPIS
jgi:hypothetical protein